MWQWECNLAKSLCVDYNGEAYRLTLGGFSTERELAVRTNRPFGDSTQEV
ncbi:hypothetical protein OP10G_1532 [Fimbriimonas ginsengisoli Gsoil 348]|uniref:Uncharacterized protein n=1 Tax=Fimbriimonas ginsengisoli Gsoil 348 TaxID=661478 RepID=A0A068NQ66_FIMGI|nr:hypothetical protein OP10G_1532 [Fimbriimonas ginsengisoli Gsoil 348]